MKVQYSAPVPVQGTFLLELTEVELARIVGIIGSTFGSDSDGLYSPLNAALTDAGFTAVRPRATKFSPGK